MTGKKPQINDDALRARILRVSVADLKEFGWPKVDSQNIITDAVYSIAFKSNLEEVKEKFRRNPQFVRVINQLLDDIKKAKKK